MAHKSPKNAPRNKGGDAKTVIGTISTTSKGGGYIDSADPQQDSIFVDVGFLNTALNGDNVEVKLRNDGNAEVVKVLDRAKDTFVGRIAMDNGSYVLIPDDKKMYLNLVIASDVDINGEKLSLKPDLKAFVKLLPWTNSKETPKGQVIRIIGEKGVNDVEMESIALQSGFDLRFPPDVEKEAENIRINQTKVSPQEIARRKDLRNVPTFTIDPFDAKDFDDAISFRKLNEGEWKDVENGGSGTFYEIGVHIADVSHYVREGTALDREALKRGCSVYLVDRTIPMLPEVLSNDLCSLKPNEDKLAYSAVFVIDDKAHIHSRWFGHTIIRSIHRFTYETAQAAIDNNAKNILKYSDGLQTEVSAEAGMKYHNELVILNDLAKMLMKDKFSKGAVEFDQEEIKFRLNAQGKPVGVYKKERLETHKLVEEYMLLANQEVAKFIFDSIKKKASSSGSIYRIHDAPDKDRIKNLAFFVKALGYNLVTKNGAVTSHALNDLLEQIEDTPHESLVRTATIRSMQKAVYSTQNIGHFGLAFKFYTHFTSPIRRYPDVLVHRILDRHLDNSTYGKAASTNDVAKLQNMADSSTRREIDAAEAERSSVKLKQVEYMSEFIGQTFKGTISGVTKWGIYVEEKETKSEGMIRIGDLGNEYYNFDEKTFSIIGEKTGKKYTLGDSVTFKVMAADLDKRTLDYKLVQ